MMKQKSIALQPRGLFSAGVLAMTLAASSAWAQADHPTGAGGSTKPNAIGEVVVRAPPAHRRHHARIPPAKAAAFAAQAAKNDAWRKYRDSTPSVTAGTLDQAAGYPGLRSAFSH